MAAATHGASPRRTAHQVCGETRRRKVAYGLCQCFKVGGSLRATVSTGTLCCCKRSRAILKLIDGTESGTYHGPSVGPGQPRYLGFNAGRVCAAESNPRKFGEPPIIHWPPWIRGAAVERRANLTPLDYRRTEDLGRSRFQARQWAVFTRLRAESPVGERMERDEIDYGRRSSDPSAVYPGQDRASPRSGKCGDANYASTCHGDWDDDQRFGNRPYKEFGYGTNWGPNTGGRDRSMDASKLYKVAGCKQGDAFPYARGSAPYRVYKCLRPLPRAYPLPHRAFGESPHRRNRGRVCGLCGIVDCPCSASWFVCFPVPLWGRAKPLEEHYYALRTTICVCAIPASTAYADCMTGAYSKLGSSGSTSYYACNATTGTRTKIYGSTDTTADGGGARDPGFPPSVERLSKSEEIARYLSLSSLLSSQMRWYSERGLVTPS